MHKFLDGRGQSRWGVGGVYRADHGSADHHVHAGNVRPRSIRSNLCRVCCSLERLVRNWPVPGPERAPNVPSCRAGPAAWNEWFIVGMSAALSGAGHCPKVSIGAVLVAAWNDWSGIVLFRGLKATRTFQAAARVPQLGTNGSSLVRVWLFRVPVLVRRFQPVPCSSQLGTIGSESGCLEA